MKSAFSIALVATLLAPLAASAAGPRGGARSFSSNRSSNVTITRSSNATHSGAVNSTFNNGLNTPYAAFGGPNTYVSPVNPYLLSSGAYRLTGLNNGAFNVLPNGQIADFPTGSLRTTENASAYAPGLSSYTYGSPLYGSNPYNLGSAGALGFTSGLYSPGSYGAAGYNGCAYGAGGNGAGIYGAGGIGAGNWSGGGFGAGIGAGGFAPSIDESASDGGPPETPDSTVLKGAAQLASAAGSYNLNTSLAALKANEAENLALNNATMQVKTFYAMREAGREGRAKERGPAPSANELAQRAHAFAPRTLTTNQIDPVSGELHWPSYLQDSRFGGQRLAIEECAINWVRYGQLSWEDQSKVRENVTAMFDDLKSHVGEVPPQEYVACRSFLQSLLYATTKAVI